MPFFPFPSTLSVSRNIDEYAPHTGPKLSPCLLTYTAKQGHSYLVLRNSSQFFLWQIIVRLIWNGNTLRRSSKSTMFKQKIHLNFSTTLKFQDRNGAHAHCSIWSCWQITDLKGKNLYFILKTNKQMKNPYYAKFILFVLY